MCFMYKVIEFSVTDYCDWNCEYCSFPLLTEKRKVSNKILTEKWLFDIINNILFDSEILIQGGEIGTLELDDIYLLEEILKLLNRKVIIDTNGLFIVKNYHKILKKYIDKIYLHVTDNGKNTHIDKIKEKNDLDDIIIIYGIVGEPDFIIDYLTKMKDITFEYVDIESSNVEFSYEKNKEKIKKINLFQNNKYTNFFRNDNKIEYQRSLCKHASNLVINLQKMKLMPCMTKAQIDYTSHLDLTYDNFKKILTEMNVYNITNDFCKKCYRSCFIVNFDYILRNKITYKKRIELYEKKNIHRF